MHHRFCDIAFTTSAFGEQVPQRSRHGCVKLTPAHVRSLAQKSLSDDKIAVLATVDGCSLGKDSETGRQHVRRLGGPARFVHMFDRKNVAWADFSSDRHYVSNGNAVLSCSSVCRKSLTIIPANYVNSIDGISRISP